MSPVNLSALPTNAPLPTGAVSKVRGQTEANPNVGAGTILTNGAVNLAVSYTPTYRCWWMVSCSVMWLLADVAWYRVDWGLRLNRADLRGRTDEITLHRSHNSLGWHTSRVMTYYFLEAGLAYTATAMVMASQGTHYYHQNYPWQQIHGIVVGEGTL